MFDKNVTFLNAIQSNQEQMDHNVNLYQNRRDFQAIVHRFVTIICIGELSRRQYQSPES